MILIRTPPDDPCGNGGDRDEKIAAQSIAGTDPQLTGKISPESATASR